MFGKDRYTYKKTKQTIGEVDSIVNTVKEEPKSEIIEEAKEESIIEETVVEEVIENTEDGAEKEIVSIEEQPKKKGRKKKGEA